MARFRTARQHYFLITALMMILFGFSYVILLGFQNRLSASAEKVQAATKINKEIVWLSEQFWKLRFWEKVVQNRTHPDAEHQFGILIENIQNKLDYFDPKLFKQELCINIQEISFLLDQYEELFNRLIQFKTEQRLNRTQVESTFKMLSSAILFSHDPDLLKSLLNIHTFLDRYINRRSKSEYNALMMVFEFVQTSISQSEIMDNRIDSYMDKFEALIKHDFAIEMKIRQINFQFDKISGELPVFLEEISQMMETFSWVSIETGEKLQTRIRHQSFVSAGTALIILLYLINFIAKKLVDPIRYMSQVVMQIKAGDTKARFVFSKKDEIARLGNAFNEMLDIIQQHRKHLESQVHERTEKLIQANKQLQQEVARREQATVELQKAHKLAEDANQAKSIFIANMSHEIRTPMNAILGFSEILNNQIRDSVQKNYLEKINTSGKTLLFLINDILDLSKIEAGKLDIIFEPVNIKELFNEIHSVFINKFQEKRVEFIIEIAQDMPAYLFMDEVRVRQILVNLVGNAVKFTSKGHVKLIADCIDKNMQSKLADFIIMVEDTGIGIPEEQQSMVFKSFIQQEGQNIKKYGGTGLGLAITQKLVKMMNGKISLNSNVGKGSCFKIVFSEIEFKDELQTGSQELITKHEEVIFNPARLLVVDDIEFNRELIKGYFKDTEIKISESDSGEHALNLLDRGYNPSIILMDLRMPGKDGYETTEDIKKNEKYSNIPIIACTAAAMKDEEEIITALFDGYIKKPIARNTLFEELKLFLPYKTKLQAAESESQEPCLSIIPESAKTTLPALILILDNEYIPRWKVLNEMFYLDEISDFANDLKKIGDKYNFNILVEYGKELYIHTQSMDLDKISPFLDKFPKIVEKIKLQNIAP